MAQRKKNKKAEDAMAIADIFKETVALSTLITMKLREAGILINGTENDSAVTATVRTDVVFLTSDLVELQAVWHNYAHGLGYFETVEVKQKMSKTEKETTIE